MAVTSASTIAAFLGTSHRGPDVEVSGARSLTNPHSDSVLVLTNPSNDATERLNALGRVLCITTKEIAPTLRCAVVAHENPRLAFCKILEKFFPERVDHGIHPASLVAPTARLAPKVSIGPGSTIGADAEIGEGTRIGSNVIVAAGVKIGRQCVVKSNTVIGERGFGFAREENDIPIAFPHLGSVHIGDYVEVGANCTVVRAALDVTVVEDYVKTDDHVHIAHNCRIGTRSFIAAGVVVSGSVTLGSDVWVGPNATIIDYVEIGAGARVSLGAVVMKSVPEGRTAIGNPARITDKR